MTFTDYLLDSVLVLLVVVQIRERRLDRRAVLLPLGIAGAIGYSYLDGIPTGGNDLSLITLFTAIGLVLGLLSAAATRVRTDGGRYALVKAGWVAGGAWVLGMGFRMAFSIWADHGGDASIARFSVAHHLTSGTAWTAALVLMAMAEVATRTAVLALRAYRVQQPTNQRELATV